MRHPDHSVLIVSENDDFVARMRAAMPEGQAKLSTEQTSLAALNGHAAEMTSRFDIVVFDADPDNGAEIEALGAAITLSRDKTAFLAMTDEGLSIARARALNDLGVDEVLPQSISDEGLRQVMDSVLERRRALTVRSTSEPARNGRLIAVAKARGGVGATSVAVNLACGLVGRKGLFRKATGARVALLDLDLQFGNTHLFLDIEDNGGLLELIRATHLPDAHFVQSILQDHQSGLKVLTAPEQLAPIGAMPPEHLSAMLDLMAAEFDYIVVDLPRALVDWMAPIFERADVLAVVTDTSVPCIRQARRLLDFVREDHAGIAADIIVNRESRPLIRNEHLREAESVLGQRFRHWLPDNPRAARAAVDLGRPVVLGQPRTDLAKAFERLAKAVRKSVAETHAVAG